ncbi:HAMP domain-containing sensor histidine kinase [Aliarcobacter skirrowii]|uniref:HAMP domain-containing sensor histidine kinase n=1 Tax=Aliarcobacter skirrowii TaxID=28200 RepID=UPI0029A08589|nr:HAMP domain-containing sensor histidine kinase [Aliarcobacter skirrowii]MDX4027573.1 HAMP domain-containing sensor histidine kinase [Aliarcobacter skirrowii]
MKKLLKYFDTLKFSYKANFLIFIIAGGMISIIVLSQISIFILKDDFDTLFDKRTKSLIKLQTIKDSYKINIQDTLNEFEKNSLSYEQTIEVLNIAKEIIEKNWSEYKYRLNKDFNNSILSKIKTYFINSHHYKNQYIKELNIENIDNKMVDIFSSIEKLDKKNSKEYFTNINFNIDSIFVYLGSLVNYDLNLAINEKRDTNNIFKLVTIFSFISIFFVVFFTIILSLFITFHFRKLYYLQEKIVEKKTKELKELNNNLEQKIKLEVAKNRKKDIIMFQQARFASLGEMLNNIAHQWRQPLGSITMIIQSFQTKMRVNKLSPEFVEQKVKDALLLAQNMSNTLDDFKNFFSPNRSKNSFFIKDCVEHSIELSKYFLNKENIKIDLIVKKDKQITTFYNELSHTLLNIISNSKDALVSSVNKNDRIIKIIVNSKKNFVFINIIDNGGGVPDDILPKIFEPYYTTKYKSAGTGIGLYMSKQIIEKHLNGEISCKNIKLEVNKKVFKGASFTITIPIFEDKNE